MYFFSKIRILIVVLFVGCHPTPDELIYEQNYLKGLELGAKMNKPIFIHFTGFACMAYNEFEKDLISSEEILNKLNEEFITVQLHVDDRRPIEANDTLNFHLLEFSEDGQKRINKATNKGHLNLTIQLEKYHTNAQPWYVIIDKKGTDLIEPFGYTNKNRDHFLLQLKKGLAEFNK